ncbi:MAG: hypothetical protein R3F34_16765 [Planctomycetota bacterium]
MQRTTRTESAVLRGLVALLLALVAACSTTKSEPEGEWATAQLEAPSGEVLWNVAMLALAQYQFPRGTETDPNTMTIETGWKIELSTFRGQGWRKLAVVKLEDLGAGMWQVDVRVKKQTNEAIVRQTDLSYAKWEWADDDVDHARIILQYIRSSLLVSG